ncbi:MAG TPA: hypothetical protein VHQ42_03820, partial [Candidatus Limnocylindria bacterium]|nr:hypothetical protein [Candidatus Limnocylindria bacterium]
MRRHAAAGARDPSLPAVGAALEGHDPVIRPARLARHGDRFGLRRGRSLGHRGHRGHHDRL